MPKHNSLHVVLGSGPLGLSVAEALVEKGHPVRVVNRSGKALVPAGVELFRADLSDLAEAERACQYASVIYQCTQPPYHRWVSDFPALHTNTLTAAKKIGARLVIGENLYMYGEVSGPIHEELPYRAATRKGRLRAQMAVDALTAHRSGSVQVTIGRGSDFFGPRVLSSTLGERVFLPAIRGKPAMPVGRLDQPHTYTYIKDFGRALVILGERDEAFGQAWHVPNAETLTQGQILAILFDELALPPKIKPTGRWMMRLGGLFIPEARESVEMMYEFERPFNVDSSKFSQTFHMQATPIREAIRETVKWYANTFATQVHEKEIQPLRSSAR